MQNAIWKICPIFQTNNVTRICMDVYRFRGIRFPSTLMISVTDEMVDNYDIFRQDSSTSDVEGAGHILIQLQRPFHNV